MTKTLLTEESLVSLLKSGADAILKNDNSIAQSLYEMVKTYHPEFLKLCFDFSSIAVSEFQILECKEAAAIIIEEFLDPEMYQFEALKLMGEVLEIDTFTPLWFYLARGSYGKSKEFRNALLYMFKKDPAFFAEVMEKTRDPYYLETIERKLCEISHFVKYLPLAEDSHEHIPEHDMWLRMGSAYLRLLKAEDNLEIESFHLFMEERFFKLLPAELDQWLATASVKETLLFQRASKTYYEFYEIIDDE